MVQDIIVYSLILIAIVNVVYKLVKTLTSKNEPECGTCPSCNTKTAAKSNIPKHLGI